MTEVTVVCEGQTEETFIKQVMAPAFHARQIFLKPIMVSTSPGHHGGALTFDRILPNVRNALKSGRRVTTLFDLYRLHSSFPGVKNKDPDVYIRVAAIEKGFHEQVVQAVGKNVRADWFIPHIQPYEFESLLFSDVGKVVQLENWDQHLDVLKKVRDTFTSPEHINDHPTTAPSKRLLATLVKPAYDKVRHGALAAQRIGIDTIKRECKHFQLWCDRLQRWGNVATDE